MLLQKLYTLTLTYFLGSNNLNINISETVRASSEMCHTGFIDFDICNQM